ncbi:MAG: hypothetical protein A2W22_05170 [Candidatus Levybacteria bacterium RBG_16_35_11]|nr:MAG: hypothetical protein A2W22_05170 [Candidatus Levybacteria bacterium RBG_16_35_11]
MKIKVVVHPNSKKKRMDKDLLGILHVYVSEPPLKGRANMAVIESLTKYFKTKRRNVILLSGSKSKNKAFEILGSY